MNKSCLNCVWSGFVIEKEDGLYSYEGDCHHPEEEYPLGVYDCVEDDREELKKVAQPLFEFQADRCKCYKQAKAIRIKLMADHGCYPLWWVDCDRVVPVEPELPLSEETAARLQKWADSYDDGLDWDDPGNSPDPTPEESAAFEREGISLWGQLQKELAPNYEVVYFSQILGRVVTDVSELEEVDHG